MNTDAAQDFSVRLEELKTILQADKSFDIRSEEHTSELQSH